MANKKEVPEHVIRDLNLISNQIQSLVGNVNGEALNTKLIVKRVGYWLHISGDTKMYSKQIKGFGCFYSGKKKMWFYKHPEASDKKGGRGGWQTRYEVKTCDACKTTFKGGAYYKLCKPCWTKRNKSDTSSDDVKCLPSTDEIAESIKGGINQVNNVVSTDTNVEDILASIPTPDAPIENSTNDAQGSEDTKLTSEEEAEVLKSFGF